MISDVVEINLLETRQVGKYLVQVRQTHIRQTRGCS